jgi:hypothetical protein
MSSTTIVLLLAVGAALAGYMEWAEARHPDSTGPMPVGCIAAFVAALFLFSAIILWAVDHVRILP